MLLLLIQCCKELETLLDGSKGRLEKCLLRVEDHKAHGITVQTEHERVTAREFEEAILSCKHNAGKETEIRVEWKKVTRSDVSFVYFGGTFVGDFNKRAKMWDSSIRIKNVTRKDAGKYRCEISASTGQGQEAAEIEISLLVLVPPAIPVSEVPISAMSGTVVELRCKENEGSPASKYKWYRSGIALLENPALWRIKKERISYTMNTTSGTLLFNPVSKNDTGEYYCEASNGIGPPQKSPVKRMQVDDLNVSAIIAAVVIVALVVASCGLGVYYAQKKGYFSKRNSSDKKASKYKGAQSETDFKHTKSFVI
ncbi:junctional adhesion molecule B isoform X2 [Hemicordylus capensis]|uniref:junctional adhesion molecule B isoform X2 n=1 Tax=Hemicordylus capensis TaxID=884348 RepID=UPI0023025F4E|nr:junctional adhesion molecule B isoform X2 [Hemicordylus capensis]